MIRGSVALIFVLAGADKFGSGWIGFFDQVGIGQWFRYFTGGVEIPGAVLVMIPRTVLAGLALLGCTMASAADPDFGVAPAGGQRFLQRAERVVPEPEERV